MERERRALGRRALVGGAAWSVPAVVVATAAPATAASVTYTLARSTPATPTFSADDLTATQTLAAVLSASTGTVANAAVTYSLSGSDTSWVRFVGGSTSTTATTSTAGRAQTTLQYAATSPAPGAQVTVVASYSNAAVSWTLTYRPFTTVTSGSEAGHVLALSAGAAYAWGYNPAGGVGDGTRTDRSTPVAVTTAGTSLASKTVTGVAAGLLHSLALTSDGAVHAWGGNVYGALGDNTATSRSLAALVTTSGTQLVGKTITAVAAGSYHSVALASTGRVYTWGFNDSGQLGNNSQNDKALAVPVVVTGVLGGKTVSAIAAGDEHTVALDSGGVVYAWGSNSNGQLGNDSLGDDSSVPVLVTTAGTPMAGKTITAIAAGEDHVLALASDGTVYAWGANDYGQLGDGTGGADGAYQETPVAVTTTGALSGRTVTAIAAGATHSLVIAGGLAYAWGDNSSGQLGTGTVSTTRVTAPVAVRTAGTPLAGKTITAIAANALDSVVRTGDRLTYAWGTSDQGRLGNGATSGDVPAAVKVTVAP